MLKKSILIVLFVVVSSLIFIVSSLIFVRSNADVSAETFKNGDIRFIKYVPWKCFDDKLFSFSELGPYGDDIIVSCDCHKNRPDFEYGIEGIVMHLDSIVGCWREYIDLNGGMVEYEYYYGKTDTKEGSWKNRTIHGKKLNATCVYRYEQIEKEFNRLKQENK